MDALTLFGAVVVSVMLLFYTLEDRAAIYAFAFSIACMASAAYGFLQGAWPLGVVEIVWAGVAFRRWRQRRPDRVP
ncbi:MAG: hypothetical protein EXR43_06395 [Dehalococcoidia bacterium]|nr:hypothetical protein [Dehalococcoidia bacterium]